MNGDPRCTLGGSKPRMLQPSRDIPVTYGQSRKFGYYEISIDGKTLARRVELPEWLSDFNPKVQGHLLTMLQKNMVKIPMEHSNERQGHIFWNTSHEFDVPSVGIDEEIILGYMIKNPPKEILFVVYKFGKTYLERWKITVDLFLKYGKRIKTANSFVAQAMVPVSVLTQG